MLQEKTSFVETIMQKNVISIDSSLSVKDAATVLKQFHVVSLSGIS